MLFKLINGQYARNRKFQINNRQKKVPKYNILAFNFILIYIIKF